MDKIAEQETDICMVVVSNYFSLFHDIGSKLITEKIMFQINNRLMELSQKESAIIVHTQDDGKWKRLSNSKYEQYNLLFILNYLII